MNQKLLKSVMILLACLAFVCAVLVGYLVGLSEGESRCPLTPDAREFLHGHTLDLPEEIIDNDSTKVLLHRVTKEGIFIYYK